MFYSERFHLNVTWLEKTFIVVLWSWSLKKHLMIYNHS
ncbi:hypothetical protein SFK227_2509 [Shigella flexneri K-227]|uniref:Uncharacterized protein n=2 Tax=Shigella flexneri TaxID=623 RepID=F5NWJ1_SHIFL|nr:hypothetical protein Sd1012_3402 [Shigella dysenteriae 1012]EGK27999.1 hypothetical protein SFK218_0582 [Shigella flexneri K-218]EGK36756.1 hypothetical protein SFK227_2509 [Shigella flexneri K-227]EGK39627.1 hypothetical protein SFK304_1137 [Shigella flexneri K-304]EIQ08786.1 hypothetical protein SFK1770_3572 [Shigella flexneri K-1770]EIQ19087.1 hypothetical protein SFK315_3106 [Shigella flexneri K-315]EIQ25347.1 hypothetical protein SFK404_3054 [Shigella flexneri K-404]SJB55471.1 Unchar